MDWRWYVKCAICRTDYPVEMMWYSRKYRGSLCGYCVDYDELNLKAVKEDEIKNQD